MIPDLKGFETYYGLKISDIGDDGNAIVLGHPDEPMRLIAAMNRHAREFWGMTNLSDDRGAKLGDLAGRFTQTHAIVLEHCDSADHEDGHCWLCREIAESDWWIRWNRRADEPGAFPVTIWEV